MLLGEYAVLFGHPAVVLAVNRRARVDLGPAGAEGWSVAAPGFQPTRVGFELDRTNGFRWREPAAEAAARLVLVEKVVGSLVASGHVAPEAPAPASLTLDTREFFHPAAGGAAKLGLGSSAALTVALAEALRRWPPGGAPRPAIDLARLLDLHRSVQGGRGSGVDLAASVTGGVVEYRLTDAGREPSVSPLTLPKDLHLIFIWTGRSASTGGFLARLDEEMTDDGGAIAALLDDLGRISAAGIADLRAGRTPGLLGKVRDFGSAMEELGRAAGIPILSDEHLELRRLAEGAGVCYKPSGAGGGDLGIAFTDDPERAESFAAGAADAGFPPLDLQIDPFGVDSEFSILDSELPSHRASGVKMGREQRNSKSEN